MMIESIFPNFNSIELISTYKKIKQQWFIVVVKKTVPELERFFLQPHNRLRRISAVWNIIEVSAIKVN